MPAIRLSTIFVLPIIFLISIPLVISACITFFFSIIALSFRVFVIYAELCYALVTSYFTIPASPNLSLLTSAESEPTTPVSSLSKSRSFEQQLHREYVTAAPTTTTATRSSSFSTTPIVVAASPSFNRLSRSHSGLLSRRSNSTSTNMNMNTNAVSPTTLQSLVSGDEGRDFENLGGLRCYGTTRPASTISSGRGPGHGLRSGSGHGSRSSFMSSNSSGNNHDDDDNAINDADSNPASDEADGRAWLSINNRLGLPSHPLASWGIDNTPPSGSGSDSSNIAADDNNAGIYGNNYNSNNNIDPYVPIYGRRYGKRHHRRARTTSMLPQFYQSSRRSRMTGITSIDSGVGLGISASHHSN